MKTTLLTSIAALLMATGTAHTQTESSSYCSTEFLNILVQYDHYRLALSSAADHEKVARELGIPLSKEGIWAARRADDLGKDIKTKAQAYVNHSECAPADRAHIKKFTNLSD